MKETLDAQRSSNEGKRAYQAKNFTQAAAAFSQAAQSFLANGQAVDAAEAANNASVAYLQAGDAASALQAAEGSDSVFAAAGETRKQGMALANQAAALDGLGRLEDSLARYTLAAELLKQIGADEMRALVLKNISTLQLRTGKQLQALASMDAALDHQPRLSLRERLLHKLLRVPLDMLKRN
jgi:tetratricopeptide (TPR) repeat protein